MMEYLCERRKKLSRGTNRERYSFYNMYEGLQLQEDENTSNWNTPSTQSASRVYEKEEGGETRELVGVGMGVGWHNIFCFYICLLQYTTYRYCV